MLEPTLTKEVINSDQLHRRFSDDWDKYKAERLRVGDLVIMPKMWARSAVLRLREVVEVKEDGRVLSRGRTPKNLDSCAQSAA